MILPTLLAIHLVHGMNLLLLSCSGGKLPMASCKGMCQSQFCASLHPHKTITPLCLTTTSCFSNMTSHPASHYSDTAIRLLCVSGIWYAIVAVSGRFLRSRSDSEAAESRKAVLSLINVLVAQPGVII